MQINEEETINAFLANCSNMKSIEFASDIFIPSKKPFFHEGNQYAISKSFYKIILKCIVENLETDSERATKLGVITGSYNNRVWVLRRKRFCDPCSLDSLINEIHLIHLGLTAVPKCAGAFENLRWVFKSILKLFVSLKHRIDEIVKKELEFYAKLTGKCLRNALLWRHRVWFSETFHTIDDELNWVEMWVSQNPSDSSAFYFLETLISTKLPTNEYDLITAYQNNTVALFTLPGHESIWTHRRYLLQKLINHFVKPVNWKLAKSPNEAFKFPLVSNEYNIRSTYLQICDKFGVDLNYIISRTDPNKNSCEMNIENEDLIIAVSRGDKFPSEYEKQCQCAEKHYIWLHVRYLELF